MPYEIIGQDLTINRGPHNPVIWHVKYLPHAVRW